MRTRTSDRVLATLVIFFQLFVLAAYGIGAEPPTSSAPAAAPDAWSDYLAAKAKWDSDCAAIQAQHDADVATWNATTAQIQSDYDAAVAAYATASAQYAVDKAAFDAAVAAVSAYPGVVAGARATVVASFVSAVDSMQLILFGPTWAGPWGYAGNLSTWMNAPPAPLPAAVTDPFVWIRVRLVANGVDPTQWDAHVAAVRAFEQILLHPPTAPPAPIPPTAPDPPTFPPPPAPPVFPPPPVPPVVAAAAFKADPTGYIIAATGVRKATTNPIRDLWGIAKPGDIIDLAPGDYLRCDLKPVASRPVGGARVSFRGVLGPNGERPRITRAPEVGGSDTLQLLQGVADSSWENIDLIAASRAGLKTTDSKNADGTWSGTGPNHTFKGVRLLGGFNPTIAGSIDPGFPRALDTLWGFHEYMSGNVLVEDCEFRGVYKEHVGCYAHNIQGDFVFRRCLFKWAGRTASQFMARTSEGPIAKGNISFIECTAIDTCLEPQGGGSAFTFRGGAPNTDVLLDHVVARLGCDPALMAPFNQSITGCVMMDSATGSGLAYPGGTRSLKIDGCDFEVGTAWPGVGGARRDDVSVSGCGTFTLKDTRIVQGPQAHPIALAIDSTVGDVFILGNNTIVGRITYNGVGYLSLAALLAAKDPDGDGKLAE